MKKQEIVKGLESFSDRLTGEVVEAFESRGRKFGNERFRTWRRKFSQFLDENLPGESTILNQKLTHYVFSSNRFDSDAQAFWKRDGDTMLSYIDSLVMDVNNDEYECSNESNTDEKEDISTSINCTEKSNKIFIVHGHDGEAKTRTARFIEKLGFEALILHEQASRSKTIIEKIEKYSDDIDFAIVLYTPDDMGNAKSEAEDGRLKFRARQNVVFEHGFLMGKIGRANVIPLVEGNIELPNDISGIVYLSDSDWQIDIAKEMSSAGYDIDFNQLYK